MSPTRAGAYIGRKSLCAARASSCQSALTELAIPVPMLNVRLGPGLRRFDEGIDCVVDEEEVPLLFAVAVDRRARATPEVVGEEGDDSGFAGEVACRGPYTLVPARGALHSMPVSTSR